MSFDYQKVWDSKQAQRDKLAALPLGEKFRLLDALAERALAIRASNPLKAKAVPGPISKP